VTAFQALEFQIYGSSCHGQDYVPIFKLYSLSKSMCIKSNPDDSQINESVNGCAVESDLQVREQIKRLQDHIWTDLGEIGSEYGKCVCFDQNRVHWLVLK